MSMASSQPQEAVSLVPPGPPPVAPAASPHTLRLPVAVLSSLRRGSSQQSLEQLEAQLQALFEQQGIGVFRSTPTGELLSANRALRQLLGIAPGVELGSYNLRDFCVRRDAALLPQPPAGGHSPEYEVQLRRTDGTVIWVAVGEMPLDASGVVEGLMEEVTERKRAEESLWLGEEYFRALIEHSSDVIYVLNADGTIRYASPSVERVLGWRPEELLGRSLVELLHPVSQPVVWSALGQVGEPPRADGPLGGGAPQPLQLRHRDGSWRHCEGQVELLLQNPVVAGVVIYSVDATRRRAEQRHARRRARRAREALAIAGVARWWLDAHSGQMRWSPAVHALFGTAAEGFDGSYGSFLKRVHPEDVGPVTDAIAHAVDDATPLDVDFRVVRADGSIGWLNCRARLRGADGSARLHGVASDVTHRREAEAALRHSELHFRRLVEGNEQLFFFVLDEAGHFEYVSPAVRAMLGYASDELLGQPFERLLADAVAESDAALRAARSCIPQTISLRHRDGRLLSVELITMPAGPAPAGGRVQGLARDITERRRVEERLLHEALHDPLTGLPNRTLFTDRLQHTLALAERHPAYLYAVLLVDLDRFKRVNDSLGHLLGDQLLVAISRRLEGCLRPGDTVARFGGDEFIVLLDHLHDSRDATRVAERILHELSAPFNLAGHDVYISASIGSALSSVGGRRPDELLHAADQALYRAKLHGRGRHEAYDRTMQERALALLRMENDLRHALRRHELHLVYQPIVALESGSIVGFEALLRWQHTQQGAIPPTDFIPVAEDSGIIRELDRWAMQEAGRQLRAWTVRRPSPPLHVCLNVSAKELAHPGLVDRVRRTLEDNQLGATSLRLEARESALLDAEEQTGRALQKLREMHVPFLLDDFGTGASALGALRRFPIQTLKIDRTLVGQLGQGRASGQSDEMIRAMISLAHSLDMSVVAEGTETADQVQRLRDLGCDFAQGYFFGAPIAADAVSALIDRMPVA